MKWPIRTMTFAGLVFVWAPVFAAGGAPHMPTMPAPSGTELLTVPINPYNVIGLPSTPIRNPDSGNRHAIAFGKKLFGAMNCAGCHSPGGGGGMGVPLSDPVWIYGSEPAQIYLSIAQGRPNGMPAWGTALPPQAIWALVTYVKTLQRPGGKYAVTTKISLPPKESPAKTPQSAHKQPPQLPSSMYKKKYPPAARTQPPAPASSDPPAAAAPSPITRRPPPALSRRSPVAPATTPPVGTVPTPAEPVLRRPVPSQRTVSRPRHDYGPIAPPSTPTTPLPASRTGPPAGDCS